MAELGGEEVLMPFRSTLKVAHVKEQNWELLQPLVWQGSWQYIVIRTGFQTDFASIPKPVRWLLDNAGANAEAAVLHDAAWRESQRRDPRIDPWHADGMFRRALRESGRTALTRGLMWFAVRVVAMLHGRLGHKGPSLLVKVGQLLQLLVVLGLGIVSALGPTVVALLGLLVFWLCNWPIAWAWYALYERRVRGTANWPSPATNQPPPPPADALPVAPAPIDDYLVVITFDDTRLTTSPDRSTQQHRTVAQELTDLLAGHEVPSEAQISQWVVRLAGHLMPAER
jgi:Protein of unknown function (DUF1353)